MKTLLSMCAGAALCILASCSEGPTKQMPYNQGINVIPMPVSLVQNEGSFKLSKNTAFSASTPEAKTVAEYFAAQMNLATGYRITVSDKASFFFFSSQFLISSKVCSYVSDIEGKSFIFQ